MFTVLLNVSVVKLKFKVILNYFGLGMTLPDAVRSPRLHSQLIPDSVDCENKTITFPYPNINGYADILTDMSSKFGKSYYIELIC